jgi:heptosyltransferase-1
VNLPADIRHSGSESRSAARRILLVRLSAMGDIVHALPIAENAWRAGVEVGWLTERGYAGLLEANPAVSRLFLADTKGWRRRPLAASSRAELRRLREDMRAFHPDVAVDVQGLWKSAMLARLSGAPVLSLGARDRREITSSLLIDRPVRLDRRIEHVVDQNLSLLTQLGIGAGAPAPDARYLLKVPRGEADDFVSRLPRPFAMLHPGSSRAEKSWGENRFADLSRRLAAEAGLTTVISWGPGDETRAERLAALLPEAPRIPLLDFAGLAHVIAKAVLFVGGDTGPVHLADALGAPAIGLFASTSVRNVPRRNRPYRGEGLLYDPETGIDDVAARAIALVRRADTDARGGGGDRHGPAETSAD